MDRNVALIWIVVLFVLEINHFKWIWWTLLGLPPLWPQEQ